MPVYKGRRPGTWRVVLWARNRSHEWVVEGAKRDAEAFEARKRVELQAAAPTEFRAAPRFASFCVERYAPHARAHLKASTWQKTRRYQIEYLCEHFGSMRLNEITTEDVEAFKLARLTREDSPMLPSSINTYLGVLQTILNWARTLGLPCSTPKIKRLPSRGHGRVKAWTEAELARLFAALTIEGPELVPMVVWLLNTGCRKGEAIVAEWAWVDLPARLIRIPSNEVWQPKSGKPREVPISSALAPYLKTRRHPTWVHPSRNGGRYVEFPKMAWWRAVERAGLDGGPHQLRHTFASMFLQRQPDMFLLAQVMGHSHTTVTEIYSHLLPNHLERARDAVAISPETMAATMAVKARTRKKQRKT